MSEQLQFGGAFAAIDSGRGGIAGFNGQMLALAREAKGFTQTDLCRRLGYNQSRLSKIEAGELQPHEQDVQNFVRELSQCRIFFFQKEAATPASMSFYRKTQTLPLKMLRQCNAQMNVRRLEIERQIGQVNAGYRNFPHLPAHENGGAPAVAQIIRREWGLGQGPVYRLVSQVEGTGCIVVDHPFPSPKLDGVSFLSCGKPPFIFLNRDLPKSRRRLSLAHELGHLVMHRNPHEHVEDEAWDFASEFLAPAAMLEKQLQDLDLDKLGRLKCEWGISMQALLHRAFKLGRISESYSRFLWVQIGKFGYRQNEPFEDVIPDERPTELEKRFKIKV